MHNLYCYRLFHFIVSLLVLASFQNCSFLITLWESVEQKQQKLNLERSNYKNSEFNAVRETQKLIKLTSD